MKVDLNIGDLILDYSDGEIGTVMSIGPGLHTGDPEWEDGFVRSWKVLWPSLGDKLYDVGEDDFLCGDCEIISKA